MVKQPKAKGDKEKAVVLERQYGPYSVKICFAEQSSGTAQNLLDVIILSELLEKVEVGKGYQVTIRLKMSYQQFLDLCAPEDQPKNTLTKSHDEEVA